jgi:hypothetical protein
MALTIRGLDATPLQAATSLQLVQLPVQALHVIGMPAFGQRHPVQTLVYDRFQVVVGHEGLPVVQAYVDLGAAGPYRFQSGRRDRAGVGFLCWGNGVLQIESDDVGTQSGGFVDHFVVVAGNVENGAHDSHT